MFGVFDKDGDGFITMDEVMDVLLSMGMNPSEDHIREVFQQVDLDGKWEKLLKNNSSHFWHPLANIKFCLMSTLSRHVKVMILSCTPSKLCCDLLQNNLINNDLLCSCASTQSIRICFSDLRMPKRYQWSIVPYRSYF